MDTETANNAEGAAVVAAYLAASAAALAASQRLNEAWRGHFEEGRDPPSDAVISEAAALQAASASALALARLTQFTGNAPPPIGALHADVQELAPTRRRRRRKRENKVLASLGRPGQRLLRATVLILLLLSLLMATAAGISLALEIAGFLHLIEDPTQMPVGIQLVTFVVASVAAFGLKRALRPVERALYGSKGVRPKPFSL